MTQLQIAFSLEIASAKISILQILALLSPTRGEIPFVGYTSETIPEYGGS